MRVRFRGVARRRARVLITGGGGSGCRGTSPLGFVRGRRATVRLGAGCGYESLMTRVVAHELGHVLGLRHEDRVCAAMNSGSVTRCTREPDFQYRCRILEPDDVFGAVRRYGGSARPVRPDEFCPVFAPPLAPSDLTVTLVDGWAAASFTIVEPARLIGDPLPPIFIELVVLRFEDACPPDPAAAADPAEEPDITGAEYGPQTTNIDFEPEIGLWCYAIAVADASGRRGPFAAASLRVIEEPDEPEPEP